MTSLLSLLTRIGVSDPFSGSSWAREASPTLGCSIEISRDIMLWVCRMSVVCQINCVGGITYGLRACSKYFFGG